MNNITNTSNFCYYTAPSET